MRSPIAAPDGWIDIASGHKHGAAIDGAGRLWTWGGVTVGEPIPDYATVVRPPADVSQGYVLRDASGGRTWTAVAAARFGTCAVDGDGALFCSGQLKETLFPGQPIADLWPLELVDRGPVVRVGQGFNHVCYLEADESLHCAGSNLRGELGVVDATATRSRVGPIGSAWAQVSVGYGHTCAVRTSGALYCWGNNPLGQVGGADAEVRTPLRVCVPP
jgi:alpha-tubulin suppressor-like RCC1 family protein